VTAEYSIIYRWKLHQVVSEINMTKLARRKFIHLATGAATLPIVSRIAKAQAYPSRPITIVVGAAAGGPTDTIGRIVTERMRNVLGQTIVIENNGAAAGSIAHGRVARSAPDGYTLSLGHWGTHVVNGAVYSLTYDTLKDFEPVALISVSPYFIAGKSSLPVNDLKELVAWIKSNGDKGTQGTSGAGSPAHVGGVLLQSILGTRWVFVPYRGANPTMQALLAGEFDWTFTTPDQGLAQFRAGRVKPYAIAAKSRMRHAPNVPTTDEAGLPGFYLSYWHALWAPKGTSKEIVAKLNASIVAALAEPAVRQRLDELGQEVFPSAQQTPETLGALQKAEIDRWWPIIKSANIKAE
jgi:tripartite-type tricarboxylate transporter receptor subunit TctC